MIFILERRGETGKIGVLISLSSQAWDPNQHGAMFPAKPLLCSNELGTVLGALNTVSLLTCTLTLGDRSPPTPLYTWGNWGLITLMLCRRSHTIKSGSRSWNLSCSFSFPPTSPYLSLDVGCTKFNCCKEDPCAWSRERQNVLWNYPPILSFHLLITLR